MRTPRAEKSRAERRRRRSCFLSYSTRESTATLLAVLVRQVFHDNYDLRLTPTALASGEDQLQQIEREISDCSFGIVCLDGLRPNVIHEWGYMRGLNRPVILLAQTPGTVDVLSMYGTVAPVGFTNPALAVDTQLSNLKSINRATWTPDNPLQSLGVIWGEYNKIKKKFPELELSKVKEPELWQ